MVAAKYLDDVGLDIKESRKLLRHLDYTKNNTRRICLHKENSNDLQVMLIEFKSGTIFPKHKHTDKEEVLIAIEGYCDLVKSNKQAEETTRLSHDKTFICFNRRDEEHMLIIGDEGFLCVEISQEQRISVV